MALDLNYDPDWKPASDAGASKALDLSYDPNWTPPKQNTGIAGDLATDLKRGVQKLPGALTGLADIPVAAVTGERYVSRAADALGEATGFQPGKWAEQAASEYSPRRKAGAEAIERAWQDGNATDIAGAYLRNPGNVAGLVVESIPSMLAGGLVGRAALAGAARFAPAAAAAPIAPVVAGAAGEGAMIAGQSMDNISDDVAARRAAAASAAAGLAGGALGVAGGALARRIGVVDPETAIAGGLAATGRAPMGFTRRVLGGAASEGVFEELPQSITEQGLQNWAEGRQLDEGLARAAVEGTVAGGLMGAGANVLPANRAAQDKPASAIDPSAGPLSKAASMAQQANESILAQQQQLADEEGGQAAGEDPRIAFQRQAQMQAQQERDAAQAAERARLAEIAAQRDAAEDEIAGATGLEDQASAVEFNRFVGEEASDLQRRRGIAADAARAERSVLRGEMQAARDQLIAEGAFEAEQRARQREQFNAEAVPFERILPQDFDTLNPIRAGEGEIVGAEPRRALNAPQRNDALPAPERQGEALEFRPQPMRATADGQVGTQEQFDDLDEARATRRDQMRRAREQARFVNAEARARAARTVAFNEQTAERTATALSNSRQEPYTVVPHPAKEGRFAVVPERSIIQGETNALQEEGRQPSAEAVTPNVPERVEVATQAQETSGQEGEKTFAPETGTLGIPRAEMPQVPSKSHGGLVKHLNAQGIAHETTSVDAASLKPTQAEYSPEKVEAAKTAAGDRAVIVSSDGHIVDGHHQALAAAEEGKQVKAIVLDAPIDQALEAVKNSPSAQAATPATSPRSESAQPGAEQPEVLEFTTLKDRDGNTVTVRTADLSSARERMPMFTKDGKRKTTHIHRDNLDLTGEKRAEGAKEIAANPLFNVITAKDGKAFAINAAASRELNARGLAETHEVVPAGDVQAGLKGYLVRKKAEAPEATHKDPGQPAEPVTQPVIAEAIQKSARNTDFNPAEAKAWILGEIDKAIAGIPERNAELSAEMARVKASSFDYKEAEKKYGKNGARNKKAWDTEQDAFDRLKNDRIEKIARQIGYVMFDVPGDGKFKVVNTVEKLNEFKAKVKTSPGFSKNPDRPMTYGSGLAEGKSLEQSLADIQRFGGDPLAEIGNAIEIARARGKNDDALLDRFIESSGGKRYDDWRAEQEAAEEVAAREELARSERNSAPLPEGEDILAMFRDQPELPQVAPTFKLTRDGVMGAYGEASAFLRGRLHTNALDVQHKARIEARLVDAGLTKRQAKDLIASAVSLKAQETRGAGPMTFLQAKYLIRAAASRELIAPVDMDGRTIDVKDAAPAEQPMQQAEPDALAMTPKQYFDAKLRWIAGQNEISLAEVRDGYDNDAYRKEVEQEWVNAVKAGFRDGAEIDAKTLDKLEEVRPGAFNSFLHDHPAAKVPQGYQTPEARRVERTKAQEKRDDRREAKAERESITDFGEKIGGARKDVWSGFQEKLSEVPDDEIANQPLSKAWPQPDYQAMLDEGADPWVVAMIRSMRDAIPTKPKVGYKVNQWAELVKLLRDVAAGALDGNIREDSTRRIIEQMANKSRHVQGIMGRIDLYLAVGHDKSLAGVRLEKHHYTLYKGRDNVTLWAVEQDTKATAFSNWPRELATGDTKEDALAAFKAKYDSLNINEPASRQVSFDIYSKLGTDGYFIGKKIGRNHFDLAGPFKTVKEAREHKATQHEALLDRLEKVKEIPRERRDTNEPRVGEDMRNGQDVTPQMFGEAFGFRGVEFGNWVEQGRRQKDLNDAYDALMDMAAVLGIPPKAISLNGELGLAFGARGSGGVNPAAAHYEPGKVVINLTKKQGAGSLGHEWWHALDNYFSRMRGRGGEMMTGALDVSLADRGSDFVANTAVRREMIEAFGEVMRAIRSTALKARSSKLDNRRSKEYWTTKPEMSARAFESYLISKLQDQNASNDYLANIVDEKTWQAAESLGFELESSYPYPTAGEIPRIRAAFDSFFTTIQSKETDKGVMLFSRGEGSVGITRESLVQSISAQFPSLTRAVESALRRGDEGKAGGVVVVERAEHLAGTFASKTGRSMDDATQVLGSDEGGDIQGFFDPKSSLTFLVAPNLTAETAPAVLLHEALHAKQRPEIDRKALSLIENRSTRAKPLRDFLGRVTQRMEDAGESGNSAEAASYIVEQAVTEGRQAGFSAVDGKLLNWIDARLGKPVGDIVRGFVAMIRAWALRNGVSFTPTVDDLVAIAQANVRAMARGDVAASAAGADGGFSIAPKTDSKAFRDWFGKSKIRNADGSPIVVMHGSPSQFDAFDNAKLASSSSHGSAGLGHFFTRSQETAERYADGGAIYRGYLKIERPYTMPLDEAQSFESAEDSAKRRQELQREGYDGVAMLDDQGKLWALVAFEPTQFKTTDNIGTFNPDDPRMRFSRMARSPSTISAAWEAPEPSKMDDIIYTLQNKQIDMKRVVDAVKEKIGQIADQWNPYLQEELFHGRSAKGVRDFLAHEMRPLLADMRRNGVEMAEFEKFLHARHAPEANAHIAKINPNEPDLQDGGSGMTNKDAADHLASITPDRRRVLDNLAKRVDAINANTRKLMVDSGLETAETIKAWEAAYQNYVPLQREDAEAGGLGIGQGFSVRGSTSKRRTGSKKAVIDILANIAMQREKTIVRAEKNRVAQANYALAIKAPNPDFWMPVNPDEAKAFTPAQQAKMVSELTAMGLDPADAQNFVKEPVQRYVDPRTGLVAERINPVLRGADNVLALRIDGKDRYVFFNRKDDRAQRMVHALKNLDADQLGHVFGAMAKVTRFFAAVNTQWNPIFGVVNLTRDTQAALLQLSTTPIRGSEKAVLKNVMPAMRGIYAALRAEREGKALPNSQWAKAFDEFRNEGGQTGYRDMFSNSQDRADALQRELNPEGWMDSPLGKVFTANGALRVPMAKAQQVAGGLFNWLSDYNDTLENSVRLSAYMAAKDKGLSNQEAASIAKNLTVNFNRKGQIATQAGAMYAFFNAAMQGTTRMLQTLKGPAGKKILLGGLTLGALQAVTLAAAGFDDDDPPEFVRERSIIIPIGEGKYVSIPMPLGFHVIPSTSRILTEWALSGFKDTTKRFGDFAALFADTFNPIGNAGWSMQTLAPTALDPFAALAENSDWTGKPIAQEDFNSLRPTPGFSRAKDTASEVSKALAYWINLASGGTDYKPGLMSPTPDQIDYLIGQVAGGVGREYLKAEQTAMSAWTGEELAPHKIPLLGRFYGDTTGQSSHATRFYNNLREINLHRAEIEGRRKDGGDVMGYLRDNPVARLGSAGPVQVESQVRKLRQAKRAAVERGDTARVKEIEARLTEVMSRFNDRVASLER